jgi:hypothetical protein
MISDRQRTRPFPETVVYSARPHASRWGGGKRNGRVRRFCHRPAGREALSAGSRNRGAVCSVRISPLSRNSFLGLAARRRDTNRRNGSLRSRRHHRRSGRRSIRAQQGISASTPSPNGALPNRHRIEHSRRGLCHAKAPRRRSRLASSATHCSGRSAGRLMMRACFPPLARTLPRSYDCGRE